jgi:hypothetical protein
MHIRVLALRFGYHGVVIGKLAAATMKLLVTNHSPLVYGAHATTMLINDFVNERLGDYGGAVDGILVMVIYPGNSPRPGGAPGFAQLVQRAPRVTFYRGKRKIDIRVLCAAVAPHSIEGNGHLSRAETASVISTISAALKLIQPRIKATDDFDVDAFLQDAQAILADCPRQIAKWLRS